MHSPQVSIVDCYLFWFKLTVSSVTCKVSLSGESEGKNCGGNSHESLPSPLLIANEELPVIFVSGQILFYYGESCSRMIFFKC